MAEGQHFIRLCGGPPETMEHGAQPPGVIPQDAQRVLPGVALVNDHVQPRLGREVKLPAEDVGLRGFERRPFRVVVGKMVVIQSRLADRGHALVGGEFAQRLRHVGRGSGRRGWMHAHDRVDHRVPRGQFHRPPAAFHRCSDGDNPIDAGVARPLQHRFEVRGKILVVEMRVGIDQRHENRLEMMLMLNPRIARLKANEISPCTSASRRKPWELIATSDTWLVIPITNEK